MLRFVRRHALASAIVATLVVAVLASSVLAVATAQRERAQRERAEAAREFLVGVFAQANPDENKGQPFTALQLLGLRAPRLGGALRRGAVLTAPATAVAAGLVAAVLIPRAGERVALLEAVAPLLGVYLIVLAPVSILIGTAFINISHAPIGICILYIIFYILL